MTRLMDPPKAERKHTNYNWDWEAAKATADSRRAAAKEYKAKVKSGEISIEQAIAECDLPIRLHQLLTSVPSVGPVKATAALGRARIYNADVAFAQTARAREITADERTRLLAAVSNGMSLAAPDPVIALTKKQRVLVASRMADAGCTYQQINAVAR